VQPPTDEGSSKFRCSTPLAALIAAALWLDRDARLATGLFVGSTYLFGALGNLWGTRGRHPGWMLMAAALVLIAFAVGKFGG
jgi:hypothetical protein